MSKEISQARHPAITAASLLFHLNALAWPIGLAPSIVYMIRNRALQVRTLPGIGQIRGLAGPFEALGMDAMILLAMLFSVINQLQILAGYWLWKSHRKGGVLGISFLAVSSVFWWGFGQPIPPLVAILHVWLLAAGWKSLGGDTA